MSGVICELCSRRMGVHSSYVVRIEIFAEPSMEPISTEEMEEMELDEEMKRLMEEMKGMTAEEIQDQVHRRFEFRVCRACQVRLVANPLGKPREKGEGRN